VPLVPFVPAVPVGPRAPVAPFAPFWFQFSDVSFELQLMTPSSITLSAPPDF